MTDLTFFQDLLYYNAKAPLLFQTTQFFILFSGFYLIYSLLHQFIFWRNSILLLFSLFFYYKLSGFFVFALLGMASLDFFIALGIHKSKKEYVKQFLLWISVLINLGGLLYFKYTYFFIDIWNQSTGSDIHLAFRILQPIGISYFVFKSLGYVLDVNREMIEEPERNYLNYLLYVSFFPNILAGPITKARDILPQFKEVKKIDAALLNTATLLLISGLVKKIMIADYIAANMIDRVFESPQFFSSIDLFMSCYGGLVQLFFDFSGYTDMVMAFSLFLGFPIKGNFNQPFKATNVSDFWRRWHISLYEWLSEYIFQPLTFYFRSYKIWGSIIGIFVTFLISGLWHGPNAVFILWGILHGLAICWEIMTSGIRKKCLHVFGRFYKFLSLLLTFHFLVFTSVLLKSKDLVFFYSYYQQMFQNIDFGLWHSWFSIYKYPFLVMIIGLSLQFIPIKIYDRIFAIMKFLPVWCSALLLAIAILCLYQFSYLEAIPFLYIVY